MSNSRIINLLNQHGITYFVNGLQIIAYDGHDRTGKEYWIDLSGYSYKALMDWLGY